MPGLEALEVRAPLVGRGRLALCQVRLQAPEREHLHVQGRDVAQQVLYLLQGQPAQENRSATILFIDFASAFCMC